MNESRGIAPIVDFETLCASRAAVVTRAEAALVLRVDARTVSRAIEDGDLPAIHLGRRVVIPRQPLIDLIMNGAAA